MKFRFWMLALGLFMCLPGYAQDDIDLTKLTANRKTFVFNDSKHTVKKYINSQLQNETSCCGENDDRIYLEVRIDPTGYVVSAKAITGKNECFKQSAEDLVKRVKWEANDAIGPKSIYIELRPKVECKGGKDNNYKKLKVFNNELLDEDGNKVHRADADKLVDLVSEGSKKPTTPATPEKVEEKTNEVANEVAEKVDEAKTTVENTVKPENTAEEKIAEATPMASTAKEEATAPVEELTEEEKKIQEQEAKDRAVKEAEINRLREQMAELRAKKIEEDKKEAAIAKKREERAKKRAAAIAARNERKKQAEEDAAKWNEEASDNESMADGGEIDGSMSEAERLRDEIRRLEEQQRGIDEERRQREDDVRRQMDENDRSAQEMIQLEEEKLRMEEQVMQLEEQEELDMIEGDRQAVENSRREQENEYQRILDEINRLQQEAQLKIADLERQRTDLETLEAKKQVREQEIMMTRATRELERERRMEEIRLSMINNSLATEMPANTRGLNPSVNNSDLLNEILPNLTTKADSEKLKILIQQIDNMNRELIVLRSQIASMDQSVSAGTSSSVIPGTPQTTGGTRSVDPNVKSAAQDRSWENIQFAAQNVDASKYIVNRGNTPAAPSTPATEGDKRPDPSNPDTHENLPGPKLTPRFYVDGEDAMKTMIKDRLRLAGICGLAHTVFSVTLDPEGNVAAHSVLTSNSALVQMQMNAIIPTLKFNKIDQRYNQTIYQEIKAEIICNDAQEKVNLREVKDLIKKN